MIEDDADENGFVDTILGRMDVKHLDITTGVDENDDQRTVWKEWRFEDEIVKRSAHVTFKKTPAIFAEAAKLG